MNPAPQDTPETSERLFLALTLPDAVRQVLVEWAQPIPGVSWTRPEQLHLTLRFLGDVVATKIDSLVSRLTEVQVASFILPVEGVGTFPPNRPPRVVWVGVGAAHPRLFQLRQRVDDALLAAGLEIDLRTFHPHATLARCQEKAGPALLPWLRAHRDLVAPSFRVEAFDLYASELRPAGAVHTLKQRFPLKN